jgi:uncharacterized protein
VKIYLREEDALALVEKEEAEISTDLGITRSLVTRKMLHGAPLEKVKGDFAYMWDGKTLFKLAISGEHYARLRIFNGIPLLEMDGLRMHLIREFKDPLEYASLAVERAKIGNGDVVLDTCSGLGYTAIAAARTGAEVVTIEKSPEVISLAQENPWSRELFNSKKITHMEGDSFECVLEFNDKFTKILHDPPRLSRAGDLYSLEFYKRIYAAAKDGAFLFHYTGSPGKGKGMRIQDGVMSRLMQAGWKSPKYSGRFQAVIATK